MSFRLTFRNESYSFDDLIRQAQPWLSWSKKVPEDVVMIPVDHSFTAVLRLLAGVYSGKTFCPLPAQATEDERQGFLRILRNKGAVACMPTDVPFTEMVTPTDPGTLVVFTSGSAGSPKGVMHRWESIKAASRAFGLVHELRPEDNWLLSLPLYHISGLSVLFRAILLKHGIIFPEDRSTDTILSHIFDRTASGVSLVPTQLKKLLDAKPKDLHANCRFLIGGAPLYPELREHAMNAGLRVFESYGATETCAQVLNDGVAHPGVETRIGPDGEILIRGAMVADSCLTQDGVRPLLDHDGFWHSGDLGLLLSNGCIAIAGRIKELINSGGVKISPLEIERAILRHQCVAAAAVFGVEDSHWGERVVALVVPKGEMNPSELREYLRARISPEKLPKEIKFTASIPVGASGKINRASLAQLFQVLVQ